MKFIHIPKILILFLFCFYLSSCISVRRTVYLQQKSLEHPQNAVNDTSFNQPLLDYHVQKGDVIYVDISAYNLTDSQQGTEPVQGYLTPTSVQEVELKGFVVNSDGTLNLPVLGKIKAEGLSIEQIRQNVLDLADQYYSNPSVKVFLLNNYITVVGEVRMPGRYRVYKESLTIIEALALAGDCTDYSEREKIKILRNSNGITHVFFVDATNLMLAASNQFYMQPNDIIMVKAQAKKRFDTKDFQLILTGLASFASAVNIFFLINDRYIGPDAGQ
jgi:polysaccharide export outer membrane protein